MAENEANNISSLNNVSESNNSTEVRTEDTISVDVSLNGGLSEKQAKDNELNYNKEHTEQRFVAGDIDSTNDEPSHTNSIKKQGGSLSKEFGSNKARTQTLYISSKASPALSTAQFTKSARSSPDISFNMSEDMTQSESKHQHTIADSENAKLSPTEQKKILGVSLSPFKYMPLSLFEQSNTCLMTSLNNRRRIKRSVELSAINSVSELPKDVGELVRFLMLARSRIYIMYVPNAGMSVSDYFSFFITSLLLTVLG